MPFALLQTLNAQLNQNKVARPGPIAMNMRLFFGIVSVNVICVMQTLGLWCCLHMSQNQDSSCVAAIFKVQHWSSLHMLMQVQLDIRTGHQQTVDKVLNWFDEEGGVKGTSICDAGCGTGSLSLPLALRVRELQASHTLLMHC